MIVKKEKLINGIYLLLLEVYKECGKNLNARKKGELLRRIEKQFGKEEKTKE